MRYLMDFVIDPKENATHQVVSVLDRECRRLARWNSDQDGLGVFKMTLSDNDGDSIGRTSLETEGTYAPDVLECLKWAATFAEGSRDGRGSNLDNPRFNRWIDDCNRAIAKAEKGGGYGGE